MKFLRKMVAALGVSAGAASAAGAQAPDHAVIVAFLYGSTDLQPLFALEDQLEQAIAAARAGEFDGNEVAADGSDGTLYMYGPDAERLFQAVRPVLESSPLMRGARVTKRFGPPGQGARTEVVTLP